jgi:hypothetical protein
VKRIKREGRGRLALALTAALALAFLLIPAAQAFATTLTVHIAGNGPGGEVSSVGGWSGSGLYEGSPAIECHSPAPGEGTCVTPLVEEPEEPGFEAIFVHIVTSPGTLFTGWTTNAGESSCAGMQTECLADQFGGNVELTATFTPAKPLKAKIEGNGTVVSNPAGISCTNPTCTEETAEFEENGLVTLTASPAAGWAFKSWKKCDAKTTETGVNGRQCTVKMSAAKEVTAIFIPVKNLKVNVVGQGSVKSKPGGISCRPGCSSQIAYFAEGKEVEVLPTPSRNWTFKEWTGDCTGTGACKPTMSTNREVTATFTEVPMHTLTLTKTGGGQALIKTKPTGILCGYTCSSNVSAFYEGAKVEVHWKLNKGTTSIEWTTGAGTCSAKVKHTEVEGNCELTIGASNVALTALLE